MEEIVIASNEAGLKVYVSDTPNISLMPEDELMILATELERVISEMTNSDK